MVYVSGNAVIAGLYALWLAAQQAQAVGNYQQCATFMANHAQRQGNIAKQG